MDLYYIDSPLKNVFIGFDYIIAIFILQIGLLFMRKWYKEAEKQSKNFIILGFSAYFILFSIGLFVVFFTMNYVLPGQEFNLLFTVSVFLRGLAGFVLAFTLERTHQTIFRTRYFISLCLIGLLAAVPFILDSPFLYTILNMINFILLALPVGFTVYFIMNNFGVIRQKLIITIPGFLLLGFGLYLTTPRILDIIEAMAFSSQLILSSKFLTILGMVLILDGFSGFSFFLETQWQENMISLCIIDKTRMKSVYYKNFKGETGESNEIFAGGITGIETVIKQFTSSNEEIDVINLGSKLIILSHGEKIIVALVTKKNLPNARHILKELTRKFEFFFWDYLKYYESYNSILTQSEIFKPMEMLIRNLIKA